MPQPPESATGKTSLIAQTYLRDALETIDAELGEGAARANPALVAAYLQACATIHATNRQA